MVNGGLYTSKNVNTPSILTPTSGDTVLAANDKRIMFTIVNLGTNTLYVRLGAGATTSVFHVPLKAGTVNDDGSGGTLSMEAGAVYTDIISVAGTSPRCVITEMAP